RWLQYSDLTALVPSIQQFLDRGECLVMIDDLDALAVGPQRPLYFAALARFVARYPDNRYLLAGMELSAQELAPLASFEQYQLAPLDQPQFDAFIERWYQACATHADVMLAHDLPERIAVLKGVLHGDARLQQVAATPRGLGLCVFAHAEGYCLPAGRDVVLRRLTDLLLKRWADPRAAAVAAASGRRFSTASQAPRRLDLLGWLALEFQSRVEADGDQPRPLSGPELRALLSESRAIASIERRGAGADFLAELLRWGERHALLVATGPSSYTMPNRQLREFLAAHALARQPDFVARAYMVRGKSHWHETLRLAAAELGRSSSPNALRELLRLLLERGKSEEPHHDALLAAELLAELDARSPLASAMLAGARQRLLEIMEQDSCDVAQRVQAGFLLGRLGDPRFAGLMPPLAWVESGSFLLGNAEGYPDEGPMQLVDLPTYAIGLYQVTNQEYALFLSENLGYPTPHYWHDPRYNNPVCPVVGVTWHDAVAYCAWLTRRIAEASLLPPGMVFRLPRETEWEKAAAWDARRQIQNSYPWGNEWNSLNANTADGRGDWITAPVGCYPGGISAYGLYDCIGNVWEWTASEYASYLGATPPFHERGRYTLRGSSCASNHTHARCTYRSRLPPDFWRYHLGFRVVLGQPLT
ncbi:MAG TPA: formylglycine-generating enzyme family protein, partial [Roseiflexaceae bacterium]|nr:formylglycine-generating enzyme family protein [Roseiflexaceae bacterium]